MKKIKLSICISTFNRSDFIGETLDSIISQVNNDVEIVIVDGASTDSTKEILRTYEQKCPKIRYFRQMQNMGVDRDYNRAVEFAQGEFCWLMTDDDLLKPGAVDAVLNAISTGDYALIIVNAEVGDKYFSKTIHPNLLEFLEDKVYSPINNRDMFVDTAKYLSFIGGVVIDRSLWMQREKEQYFGTVFIHMGVIFQKPLNKDVLVISSPWIRIRYGNALWTPKKFEIWMFKWPKLIWSFSSYSESDKNKIIASAPWGKIRTLTLFRAVEAFTSKEYLNLLKPKMSFGWKMLAAKMVAKIPPPLLNFLWIIYLSILPKKSPMWLYDLKESKFNHVFKKNSSTQALGN